MYAGVPTTTPSAVSGGAMSRRFADGSPLDHRLGDAKIQDLGASPGNHHIARFQIAVDDALSVRRREAIGNIHPDLNCRSTGRGPFRKMSASVSPSTNSITR